MAKSIFKVNLLFVDIWIFFQNIRFVLAALPITKSLCIILMISLVQVSLSGIAGSNFLSILMALKYISSLLLFVVVVFLFCLRVEKREDTDNGT